MNVGFITNIQKDPELEFTKQLVQFVLDNNARPILTQNSAKIINLNCESVLEIKEILRKSDFVVVLGGDGTILRVTKNSAYFKTKILGINIGNLGYLTDVEQKDATSAIKKVLNNEYTTEKRMMLDAIILNREIEGQINTVLNEVVISSSFGKMIKITVKINSKFVDTYRADGILIATPTGSTAYNLSAGGPILKPDTELIIINYICPHALFSRPYVISGEDEVEVTIEEQSEGSIICLDGQHRIPIKSGETIKIKKSSLYTSIIKTNSLNFFDILRKKMVDVRK